MWQVASKASRVCAHGLERAAWTGLTPVRNGDQAVTYVMDSTTYGPDNGPRAPCRTCRSRVKRCSGELERILASRAFQGAGRSGALLRFLLERTLAGQADQLKEYTVGAEALGRGESFDPRTDAIVRVEVSRLRNRLSHYYATEGSANPVRIAVPKGSYAPVFESAPANAQRVGWTRGSEPRSRRPPLRWPRSRLWRSGLAWREQASPPASVTRLELDLGDNVVMRSTQVGSSSVIISPDGRRLVFVSFRNQEPRLMTRALDEIGGSESVELPGTAGVRGPFFSPDGRYVGFLAGKRLWKTRVDGGEPTVICDATELLGASWGDDGSIVAALTATGLVRVSSDGGVPEPIAGTPVGARWPQVLPGSKAVLFTAGLPTPGRLRIDVLSLADGTVKTLMEGVSHARYLASGHLAWVARQTLFVAPFDLRSPGTDRARGPSRRGHRSEHVRGRGVRHVEHRHARLSPPARWAYCRRSTGSINLDRPRRCSQRRRSTSCRASHRTDRGWRSRWARRRASRIFRFSICDRARL